MSNLDQSVRHLVHVNLLRYNPAKGIDQPFKKTQEPNIIRYIIALKSTKGSLISLKEMEFRRPPANLLV